ncbi:putative homoserine dehydrogenase-like protein [Pontibacter ummariensis]|uniref:Predicted homoserine dehydrogenase, contains C-terminal SAF domain n=1 Tax=Pontibacter ummariensis TaxID=1610492 RepID=A0A239GFB7_9BACT|nr:Gfo/Idh/MocA family oxidoreductase [Pontibacter ummariensis]PRY11223.1 putative homoserine dehydrogenase-like protein [Pontibacter ummariensis]SNS67432.1 Predicted homoserine dehydrogenase, contains C-terminal SAF domain [Pontibacter ummariensis]
MIIVDSALAKRQAEGNPIRVAMVGAGFMGRGIALQISQYTLGMELVAIANRTLNKARQAYTEAQIPEVDEVSTLAQLEENIRQGRYSITEDAMLLCEAEGVDAVIEVTGAVEFGTNIAMRAIQNGKHIIMMNAEVDGTVGPILKVYADKAGVVFTNADGDQPGVTMNLYRFVKGLGVKPVLCGNIKGLHDPYRNPTTQEGFAKKWGQQPSMVTSFADGSKISFEQAIIANGTGMRVAKRGMHGPTVASGSSLKDCVHSLYPIEDLLEGPGIVDYVVGAEPGPGVFVLGTHDNPIQQHYLNLYKLGEGPLYLFYTPYHLCHFEVPATVARAVLFQDAALTPMGAPQVSVVSAAKKDLKAGEVLDGIGHYMTYGLCENADTTARERLLPIGVAEGCVLKRDIPKDQVITYDDVVLPEGRLVDKLLEQQAAYFSAPDAAAREEVLRGSSNVALPIT